MKNTLLKIVGMAVATVTMTSCTTTYDAYGNPRQNVDPVAAAAVAGVAGYAIGKNNSDKKVYYGGPRYYGPRYGHRPYRPHYRRAWRR